MEVKIQGPIEVEIKVSITDDEGRHGIATLSMTNGRYPTEQELRNAVAKFEKESMPDGFRMMNKREWFNSVFGQCPEVGDDGEPEYINYAMPGGDNWSA